MLKFAFRRRDSLVGRAHLVCSEARRIHGDLKTAAKCCSLLENHDGRSRFAKSSKLIYFHSITDASFTCPGPCSLYRLRFRSHASAHARDFRCFCGHALDQRVQVRHDDELGAANGAAQADELKCENAAAVFQETCRKNRAGFEEIDAMANNMTSCKYAVQHEKLHHDELGAAQMNEIAQSDKPKCEEDGATAFQDDLRKNEADLQAFDTMMNKIKASGKDADAKSLEILETLLAQVESSAVSSNKYRIGAACTKLAELYSSAKEPAKSLLYAQKGFETLRRIKNLNAKYLACRCLYVIATAHCSNGDFGKALKHAEHLDLILRHLEKSSRKNDFTSLKFAFQTLLIKCKMSLGRHQEALPHFHKYVKLKEKLVNSDDPSLGAVYVQAAEAFQEADHPAEAVHFALKALGIHTEKFGSSSYQVGYVRSLLSEAYYGLGLFEECLSEYDKAMPILETREGNSKESLASFTMKSVFSLMELQRYEMAITRLKELIQSTSKASVAHVSALVTLAKVYSLSNMKNQFFECCSKALNVLESNHKLSITTGEFVCSLASTYGMQNRYEEAIMLYKKGLSIFNQCSGDEAALKAADTEGEIGIALLRLEKFSQSAPYLKDYILKNKSISGLGNARLIAVHNRLGAEYLQVGRMNEAMEQLETAKVLLQSDPSQIDDTIILSLNQNLATVYKAFGRLDDAIACQKSALDTAKNSNHEEINSLTEEIEKSLESLREEQH